MVKFSFTRFVSYAQIEFRERRLEVNPEKVAEYQQVGRRSYQQLLLYSGLNEDDSEWYVLAKQARHLFDSSFLKHLVSNFRSLTTVHEPMPQ